MCELCKRSFALTHEGKSEEELLKMALESLNGLGLALNTAKSYMGDLAVVAAVCEEVKMSEYVFAGKSYWALNDVLNVVSEIRERLGLLS